VDAHGMGRSAAAVIKGFQAMDDAGLIRGVFLNRVSAGYYQKLAPWLEETCGIPVVGFLPNMPEAVLKSRHLGLESPEENEALAKLGKTAEMLEETLDLAKLKQVAESAEPLDVSVRFDDVLPPVSGTRAVVAVAKDEAFSFFYKDNLTALQKCGLELRFFSPMRDEKLPEGASALVLYGGYPELYAKELSANASMRESIRTACDGGMPVIAECGGFMYLQEKLKTADGTFDMVGVFPGSAENRGKLIRFGYVRGTDGMSHLRGHEFHHFDVDEPGSAWTMTREATGEDYPAMHVKNGVVAGFPHFYYYSDVSFVKRFAYAAEAFSNMTRAMGRIRL
ncbi:MAG: cobyrinic acid a,c-diamide synthase, partial [Lachnospiraceae bacterium]|nr:cobyrinic acid a,c-diamide synthase [Lachnospiraceae bacterium]